MFYAKEKLSENAELAVELTEENVYCKCPVCGREVSVNLAAVFADGEGDLASTAVLCAHCTSELEDEAEKAEAEAKTEAEA